VGQLGELEEVDVVALSDLGVLFEIAQIGEREYGVPLAEGGLHAGEWETSLLLAIRPDLARMQDAEAGFTGELQEALQGMFTGGVAALSQNGAIGDPTRASVEHGQRYWAAAVELALEQIEQAGTSGASG
jgi:creatinine amidohydrolase